MKFMGKKIKSGAVCSILMGISYILTSLTFLILPSAQKAGPKEIEAFYQSVAQNMFWLKIMLCNFIFSSTLGPAVVFSLYDFLNPIKKEWIRWSSLLAIIGFSTIIISDLHQLKNIPHLAHSYMEAGPHLRATLKITGIGFDDSIVFWLIGLWMITINYFAASANKIPWSIGILGFGAGIAYLLITTAYIADMEILNMIAAIIGGTFLAPAWYISIGLILQKKTADA